MTSIEEFESSDGYDFDPLRLYQNRMKEFPYLPESLAQWLEVHLHNAQQYLNALNS